MRRNLWLGLAVVLCAASLWAGVRGRDRAPADGAAAAVPDRPVHLRVLNATDQAGLARELGLALGAAGLVIGGVGNAPAPAPAATLLVNRRLPEAAARRLAERLGGLPVVREWDDRCSEDAVLVLAADWRRVREALAAAP